ncbi:hypothetical protein [Archangium sp.]|uniref:hypothetical protein n=1 Tax=Archangium sp. TaxID=1872627 RepID=UPI00286C49D6|nr:hypothetical protein [Archangium sp.]
MSGEASYELGVVCEARADRDTACVLADRVLLEEVSWLDAETLDSCRRWRGVRPEADFLKWASVRDECQRVGLKGIFGKFGGQPGQPDAYMARLALLLLASSEHPPEAVLLVRDSDGDERRRAGLEQARQDRRWPFPVVIGLAEPKRECWVLAGFDPKGPEETERLEKSERRLSFHPVREAHRLDAREHGAKNDAKRALEELSQGNLERERAGLEKTSLEVLAERGARTGLTTYLKEVRERLVPVFSGTSRTRG